jgi:hypothetical protein
MRGSMAELILVVPSFMTSIASAPDRNVLINHCHSDSTKITITAVTPFTFDPRLSQHRIYLLSAYTPGAASHTGDAGWRQAIVIAFRFYRQARF